MNAKKKFRAVAREQNIISVLEATEADAKESIRYELRKPGREEYLKLWQDEGEQVVEVDVEAEQAAAAAAYTSNKKAERAAEQKAAEPEDPRDLEIVPDDEADERLKEWLDVIVLSFAKSKLHGKTRGEYAKALKAISKAVAGTLLDPSEFKVGEQVSVALTSWTGWLGRIVRFEGDKVILRVDHKRVGPHDYTTKISNLRHQEPEQQIPPKKE